MLTGAATRTQSFLRAPIANETERAHFQRRLSFTLLLVFVLAFGFWLATVGLHPFIGSGSIRVHFTGLVSIAQLATTFAALTGWAVVRARKWSIDFLDATDVITTLAICWGWDFMATSDTPVWRPELTGALAVSYTLVTRTAFVPSTPFRTAAVGTASFLPLVPATYAMYAGVVDQTTRPLGPAVYVAIWSTLGVTCTATISFVIYGLHLEVRKAMRLGQYLLETKIGEGGMGVVYRASHAMLRRPTAIKLLTGTVGHAVERFEREVQLTARLTHPNTIAVFDYGRTPEGVFYYAMEYLEGITLDDLVRDHGPQPPARVVHLLLQICGALEEAHSAGLVHRDIKPANVMLTERGGQQDVVKVLDFGLVKESEASSALTTSSLNAVMGTPHFMAPEAILDPQNVDGRTDLYALGVTAYFLLTGERAFDGSNLVEICSAHLHQTPVRPCEKQPEIPAALEQIVLACLEKKPEDRPKNACDLSDRLLACGVPPWSRSDARSWWEHARKASAKESVQEPAKPKRRSRRRGSSHELGSTVTIALDDRTVS
ncbi:MAG: Serine/threonine protein kinase [Labilithrix sp.]|nr:Serine/threonine protein kinase [Labilithrix sp.]